MSLPLANLSDIKPSIGVTMRRSSVVNDNPREREMKDSRPGHQSLTVVLLCSGNGADHSSYRPSRDDVRFRHRHDALVRCVATSLYGPAGANNHACELILLYDGDLACMRMRLSADSSCSNSVMPLPPLERTVVQSWKDAAKMAVRDNQTNSAAAAGVVGTLKMKQCNSTIKIPEMRLDTVPKLHTFCEIDMWKKVSRHETETVLSATNLKQVSRVKKLPSQMPSAKRDVLTILQSTCPMEYLRLHHLNSSIDVALRKANKTKLQKAWDEYAKYCSEQKDESRNACTKRKYIDIVDAPHDSTSHDENWHRIEMTFRAILSETNASEGETIAAYLHESCDAELPCWGWDNELQDNQSNVEHVFLFLGAVRDMTSDENDALSSACEAISVPLVPCRLGPVPEFTSKIVSVAGFHHSKGVLGDGLMKLWKRDAQKAKLPTKRNMIEGTRSSQSNRTIHSIVIVPMSSELLSTDSDKRDRIHWCMVRMVVCSLWRSKLASNTNSNDGFNPLNNELTFIFVDAVCITLRQKDFTSLMAENHKAAPSELQILEELCHQRDSIPSNNSIPQSEHKNLVKRTCKNLVKSLVSSSNDGGNQFLLNFIVHEQSSLDQKNIVNIAYELCQDEDDSGYTLFTLHGMLDSSNDDASTKKVAKVLKNLLKAFRVTGIASTDHRIVSSSCQEEEATTIIMLQHLDYQRRLLSLLRALTKK